MPKITKYCHGCGKPTEQCPCNSLPSYSKELLSILKEKRKLESKLSKIKKLTIIGISEDTTFLGKRDVFSDILNVLK